MAYQPYVRGQVDTANSSTATLTSGSIFTGVFTDITLYDSVSVIIEGAAAAAAPGTLKLQFSQNGSTVDRDIVVPIDDVAAAPPRTLGTVAQFFRVVYENGSIDQTSFDIQTLHHPGFVRLISRLDQAISNNEDVQNVRSALVAQNDAGNWHNIKADNDQHLKVNVSNPKTSFDELPIAELTPVSQLTFSYNINTNICNFTETNSATVGQADNMAILETGTTTNSQAILQSKKFIPFRAGQGIAARFSAVFTTGIADATSRQWIGVGDADNGFFFGFDAADFAVTYRTDGAPTIIDQSTWNVDVMDGSGGASNPSGMLLDPTKGNVYQVSYGSGFGAVNFSVESDDTGDMVLCHVLRYGNNFTVPSTYIPSHPVHAEVHNGGSTTNLILSISEMAGFIEGENKPTGPQNAVDSSITASSTEEPILSVRGRTTFASKTSKVDALLQFISLNNDANGAGTFRIRRNATFTGAPTFVNVETLTSVIETTALGGGANGTMTAGTGTLVWAGQVGKDKQANIDLNNLDLRIRPEEMLTVTIELISGTGVNAAALTWIEDF